MVTYIYFVKCPNCEDEHFDFFDDAKSFAMGRLSDKPVITQTEVDRNDFGECTDHCDLGTIWSWEEAVGDPESEPVTSITFTKDDIGSDYDPDNDPEFQGDEDFKMINEELLESRRISFNNKEDQQEFFKLCKETGMITGADLDRFMQDYDADDSNLLDKLRAYKDELDNSIDECVERKPIPEGMTIEQLVETMQENEDTVECAGCEELFPKDKCFHKEGIGYLCGDCEDRIVKCTWCDELYDKSECRYEVDLGWLCSRCEAAIKSRGETLTFREGNYWDFLDEAATKANWHKAGPKLFRLTTDKGTAEVYQNTHGIFELSVRDKSGKYLVGGNMRIGGSTVPEDETHKTKAAAMKTAEKYLVENFSSNETNSLTVIVKDSINHLTNDLGKDPWAEDFVDDVIKDIENNYDVDVPTNPKQYSYFCDAVAKEVSFQLNKSDDDVDFDNVFNMEF